MGLRCSIRFPGWSPKRKFRRDYLTGAYPGGSAPAWIQQGCCSRSLITRRPPSRTSNCKRHYSHNIDKHGPSTFSFGVRGTHGHRQARATRHRRNPRYRAEVQDNLSLYVAQALNIGAAVRFRYLWGPPSSERLSFERFFTSLLNLEPIICHRPWAVVPGAGTVRLSPRAIRQARA